MLVLAPALQSPDAMPRHQSSNHVSVKSCHAETNSRNFQQKIFDSRSMNCDWLLSKKSWLRHLTSCTESVINIRRTPNADRAESRSCGVIVWYWKCRTAGEKLSHSDFVLWAGISYLRYWFFWGKKLYCCVIRNTQLRKFIISCGINQKRSQTLRPTSISVAWSGLETPSLAISLSFLLLCRGLSQQLESQKCTEKS